MWKIWDTVKSQVQTEFADIVSTDSDNLIGGTKGGHHSVDYTCMTWLSLNKKVVFFRFFVVFRNLFNNVGYEFFYVCFWRKGLHYVVQKKRKIGNSLLILGTGSGDVLAVDVSAGQLKWRVSDCHPGWVALLSELDLYSVFCFTFRRKIINFGCENVSKWTKRHYQITLLADFIKLSRIVGRPK